MSSSYPILIRHVFRGTASDSPITAILSGPQNLKNTVSSWPMYLSCPPEPYIVKLAGEVFTVDVTSNKRYYSAPYDRFKKGPITQPDDYGTETWEDAGQQRHPKTFVSSPPVKKTLDSAFVVSFEESRWQAPDDQTPLPKYVTESYLENWPINETGTGLHRADIAKQDLLEYLRTPDGKELTSSLHSLGGKPENIDYISVGGLPKGAIYGITRTLDGKVILLVAEDAFDKIERDARAYGLNPIDRKGDGIAEEIVHNWLGHIDDSGDSIKKEIEAKLAQMQHYERQERDADSGNPNNPKHQRNRARYRRLIEYKEEDAATTPQRYGTSLFHKELYSKNREALEAILASEAIDRGYDGRGIKKYVASRLREIGDEVEDGEKLQAKSVLENIVEDKVESNESKEMPEPSEAPRE